jgi:hypothetical protein
MTASCTPLARVSRPVIPTLRSVRRAALYRIALVLAALYFVAPAFAAAPAPAHLDINALTQRLSGTKAVGEFHAP